MLHCLHDFTYLPISELLISVSITDQRIEHVRPLPPQARKSALRRLRTLRSADTDKMPVDFEVTITKPTADTKCVR